MGVLGEVHPGVAILIVLTALVAAASAIVVAGFFPRRIGPDAVRTPLGAVLVYSATLAVLVLAVATVAAAFIQLPWAVAVVALGLALLAAPFTVQPLSEEWRESRLALVAVTAVSLLVLAAIAHTTPLA
ncbi:MAG: hypothetical protein ROR55_00145 [Devosia sp.]